VSELYTGQEKEQEGFLKKEYGMVRVQLCTIPSLVDVQLLFISYEFVKGFLAITFYFFLFLSENFHDVCQLFFIYSETKFQLDPTKNEKFPHRPQIAHFDNVMSIDMTL